MLGLLLSALVTAAPWTCPDGVCGSPPPAAPEPEVETHAASYRAVMRAMPKLHGRAPRFWNSDATTVRPSMSIRSLHRRLLEGSDITVAYGRCRSHSTTCPWARVDVVIGTDFVFDEEAPTEVVQAIDLQTYRIRRLSRVGDREQEWWIWIEAGERQAVVSVTGQLGLGHAALGALPIRRIRAALLTSPAG